MTMDKKEALRLSEALKESAISLGMCDEGIAGWLKYKSLDELCEHYWEGIEFIIDHPGWPSNKWLIDKVGKPTLHAHDIYVDDEVDVQNPFHAVFNGKCTGTVNADNFSAPELYVRHNSEITVNAKDAAILHINLFDNAKIIVHCDRFATCTIYKYGGTVNYDGEGKVIVRDRTIKN